MLNEYKINASSNADEWPTHIEPASFYTESLNALPIWPLAVNALTKLTIRYGPHVKVSPSNYSWHNIYNGPSKRVLCYLLTVK